MTLTETNFKNQTASIHNLEVHVSQIVNLLASIPQRSLPINIETNLKKHVKVITLRSGKTLEQNQEYNVEIVH